MEQLTEKGTTDRYNQASLPGQHSYHIKINRLSLRFSELDFLGEWS